MSALLNWNNIKTILLDLDGTLLDLHYDNFFWLNYVPEIYATKNKISVEDAKEKLLRRYQEIKGTLDWYCVDFWSNDLELDIEKLKADVSHKIAIHPYVEKFLSAMSVMNKRIVLVTNAHPAVLSIKMGETNLSQFFSKIISAHEIGLAKENDGFWERFNAIEKIERASTVFIDDNEEVLNCANRYGIAYLFSIHKPDSTKEVQLSDKYQTLRSFAEIMP